MLSSSAEVVVMSMVTIWQFGVVFGSAALISDHMLWIGFAVTKHPGPI